MKKKSTEKQAAVSNEGREYFSASTTPATINESDRSVDIVWYTGVDVPRQSWDGTYIRRFDPKGVDLSLLNGFAPVFDNHNTWDGTESQKGVVEKAWVEGNLYKATLRFSKRPAVDSLWQDIKDKIVQKFSMGVSIVAEHEIKAEGQPVVRLADKWQPFEISCAPLPADFGTTTLSSHPAPAEKLDDEQCGCDCQHCQDGECDECTNADCDDPNCTNCPMQSGNMASACRARETEILRLK
jgi:hypothetical protein